MEVSTLTHRVPLGTLKPRHISPMHAMPERVERPEHVLHDGPEHVTAPGIKNPEAIAEIHGAGRIAVGTIEAVSTAIAPSVTTEELDCTDHGFIVVYDTYPSCLDYMDFPKSTCTPINEVTCHGIPDDRLLRDGGIINVDITAYRGGVYGDTCAMFRVSIVDEESHLLIEYTKSTMMRGIKAIDLGREISIIGYAIEAYVKRFNYGMVRDYIGRNVGEAFRFGLITPHYDATPTYGTVMEPGMVLTIEPMPTLDTIEWGQ